MNKLITTIHIALIASGVLLAEPRLGYDIGVGGRSNGLANNVVANVNDVSAAYWNPAALAFLPVREFQFALEDLTMRSTSEFFGTTTSENLSRFHLSGLGLIHAIPASQGGLSFAVAYQSPFIFDDISNFSGSYSADGNSYDVEKRYKNYGSLRYWTVAAGIQVAKNVGVGVAASIVNGSEQYDELSYKLTNGYVEDLDSDNIELSAETRFIGFDIRPGIYVNTRPVSFGARLVIPKILNYSEIGTGFFPSDTSEDSLLSIGSDGKMYFPVSFAAGAALHLPFMTVTAEGRTKFPFSYVFPSATIPRESQAKYFKSGGGIGIEVPILIAPVILRAGYSLDEVDYHSYISVPGDQNLDYEVWNDDGVEGDKFMRVVTGGLTYATESSVLEIAYGFHSWNLITRNALIQDYSLHRILVSMSFRY